MTHNNVFSRFAARCGLRFALLFFMACFAAMALSGCYEDKQNAYKATMDKHGDLVAPPDAKLPPKDTAANADKDSTSRDKKKDIASLPTEAEIGLPIYPGARPYQKDEMPVPVTASSDNFLFALLQTSDSVAQVDTFYHSHLPDAERHEEKQNGATVITFLKRGDKGSVSSVEIADSKGKTLLTLTKAKVAVKPDALPDKTNVDSQYLPPAVPR